MGSSGSVNNSDDTHGSDDHDDDDDDDDAFRPLVIDTEEQSATWEPPNEETFPTTSSNDRNALAKEDGQAKGQSGSTMITSGMNGCIMTLDPNMDGRSMMTTSPHYPGSTSLSTAKVSAVAEQKEPLKPSTGSVHQPLNVDSPRTPNHNVSSLSYPSRSIEHMPVQDYSSIGAKTAGSNKTRRKSDKVSDQLRKIISSVLIKAVQFRIDLTDHCLVQIVSVTCSYTRSNTPKLAQILRLFSHSHRLFALLYILWAS